MRVTHVADRRFVLSSLSRVVSLFVPIVVLSFTACADASTAPKIAAPAAMRRDIMCYAPGPNGTPGTFVAPDSHGNCPAGFDVYVWM